MPRSGQVFGKLNLGCGPSAPVGWVNVDGSWNAWLAHHPYLYSALRSIGVVGATQAPKWQIAPLVHDITKPLPFPDATFSVVYASHVLEHLYRAQAQELLMECRRVLMPSGLLRVVVPDLHSMACAYLKKKNGQDATLGSEAELAADYLNERLGFRSRQPVLGNAFYRWYSASKDFHSHKWMYDIDSLTYYTKLAGFREVREKGYLESEIEGIAEVEDSSRFLDGMGVCVEGKK